MKDFEAKLVKVSRGKLAFEEVFKNIVLNTKDTIIIILTENEECLKYGTQYFEQFKRDHRKEAIYIVTYCNSRGQKVFSKTEGIQVCCATKDELLDIATYLSIFETETGIVFLSERDKLGANVESALSRGIFTLEEYVAIGLYRLCNMQKEDKYGNCNCSCI